MLGSTEILDKQLIAGASVPQYRIVKFGSDETAAIVATGGTSVMLGITQDGTAATGADVNVRVAGIADLQLGGSVSLGDAITSDSVGKGVTATAGQNIIGIAANDGVSGDIIPVMIRNGYSTSAPNVNGISTVQLARATFDPSATAGDRTIAAHALGVTIPDKAIILRTWFDVVTTFTSATDAGTIALSINAANDVVSALAISDGRNMFDAGIHAGLLGFPNLGADAAHDTAIEVGALFAGVALKTTAAREITATVAVEALTAGKMVIFVEYVVSA